VFSIAPRESGYFVIHRTKGQPEGDVSMKKFLSTLAVASVALTGIAATPAMAHDRYQPGDYYRSGYDYRDDRGYDNRGDDRRYDDRRYDDRRDYRRDYRQCRRSSGTTGTIIGAIAGGLLGREIGRGGRFNEPSTTGLIIGAGAGALAGRAIDKNSNCPR
jgi:hypothetical protein